MNSNLTFSITSNDFPEQDPANLDIVFNPPIFLQPTKQNSISLVGGSIVNSATNISSSFDNNKIRISKDDGVSWYDVIFPDGNYTLTSIMNVIAEVMIENNMYTGSLSSPSYFISITGSLTYSRINLLFRNALTSIDFSIGNFYKLLGFNQQIYHASDSLNYIAPNAAKLVGNLSYYTISIDIIKFGERVNNRVSSKIMKIAGAGVAGEVIRLDTQGSYDQNVYYPLDGDSNSRISNMKIVVRDAASNIVDFRGEQTFFQFSIR